MISFKDYLINEARYAGNKIRHTTFIVDFQDLDSYSGEGLPEGLGAAFPDDMKMSRQIPWGWIDNVAEAHEWKYNLDDEEMNEHIQRLHDEFEFFVLSIKRRDGLWVEWGIDSYRYYLTFLEGNKDDIRQAIYNAYVDYLNKIQDGPDEIDIRIANQELDKVFGE